MIKIRCFCKVIKFKKYEQFLNLIKTVILKLIKLLFFRAAISNEDEPFALLAGRSASLRGITK